MIIIKLSEILGRKKLKISDVIRETGVTRPTLTSLYYGKGNGISFDTLNKLCRYLSITPGNLVHFLNLDISNVSIQFDDTVDVDTTDEDTEYISNARFTGIISFSFPKNLSFSFSGTLSSSYPHDFSLSLEFNITQKVFKTYFDDDSEEFIEDYLSNEILDKFDDFDEEAQITTEFFSFAE